MKIFRTFYSVQKSMVDICEILQMVEMQDGHQSPFGINAIVIKFKYLRYQSQIYYL